MPADLAFQCYTIRLGLKRLAGLDSGRDLLRTVFLVQAGAALGEACPQFHLGETVGETSDALRAILTLLPHHATETPAELAAWLKESFPMTPAARTAVEMAMYDLAAREQHKPLYQVLRLPSPEGLVSSVPILAASEAELEQRIDEARPYPVLKIKCGGPVSVDRLMFKSLARLTDKPLRIDAGGGWTLDEACELAGLLGGMNVEYLEQPLPAHRVEDTGTLLRSSPVPILLSEDARCASTLDHIAAACNGFTLKLMSCGGLTEALRALRRGRELGLRIALDTTLCTSAKATAAAHLAGAVDFINLGNHLLIENDPVRGLQLPNGRIKLPAGFGLGLEIGEEYRETLHPLPA